MSDENNKKIDDTKPKITEQPEVSKEEMKKLGVELVDSPTQAEQAEAEEPKGDESPAFSGKDIKALEKEVAKEIGPEMKVECHEDGFSAQIQEMEELHEKLQQKRQSEGQEARDLLKDIKKTKEKLAGLLKEMKEIEETDQKVLVEMEKLKEMEENIKGIEEEATSKLE